MILDTASNNRGIRPISSEVHFLDWYDGPLSGVFKLDQAERWYGFNICYFDAGRQRIFSVIGLEAAWAEHFIRMLKETESIDNITFSDVPFIALREVFLKHTSDLYLMSCRDIGEVDFEIVQVSLSVLRYAVDNQGYMDPDEAYVAQLKSFFSNNQ